MDRDDLMAAIDQGPVRVHMNDGQSFVIRNHKDCAVDSTVAYVLYRRDDGKLKGRWLSLVCMTSIEPVDDEPVDNEQAA